MKWIKQIYIKGFRGIAKNQILRLAIPDGINASSGLTIMVGPNGGGKSTFIEMLALTGNGDNDIPLPNEVRNQDAGGSVNVRVTYSDNSASDFDNKIVPFRLRRVVGTDLPGKVYYVPSRRQLEKTFSDSRVPRASYSQESTRLRVDRNEFPRPVSRLVDLAQLPDQKKDFDDTLATILGFPLSWELDLGQAGYYFKITTKLGIHDSTGLGFGIISLMFVLDAVRDLDEGDIVIIDEPELSQHPAVQRRLAKLISEKSTSNQIIIATHSPYFVDIPSVGNGMEIARVAFSSRYGSRVFQLSEDGKASFVKLVSDLNNPHTIGVESKEVLFLDEGVILTEGQEDVVLLPKLADQVGVQLKFMFYGWGVGGADKMTYVCKILMDLGHRKIIGILDKDKAITLDKLKIDYPQYKFFLLPADDIRDKSKKTSPAKAGLSTSSGSIHEEYRQSFVELINDINNL